MTSKTMAEVRADLLTALRNLINALDTAPYTDVYLKATALAHVIEGLYGRLEWTLDQVFPDSCTSENLDRHAAVYGVTRRGPTTSSGRIALHGTIGTVFGSGLAFTKSDGAAYLTTEGGTLDGGGNANVAAVSTTEGAESNCDTGEVFTLSSPPGGVSATAQCWEEFTGGTSTESDATLLTRLLDRIQHPPAGGTASDWRQWCLEVEGVTEAYVYPLRRGLGTVDVCIFTGGTGTSRAPAGVELIADVETYLETVRPVTVASYQVLAATEVEVDVNVTGIVVGEGYEAADVETAVETAIEAAFPTLAPGGTLYLTTGLHGVIADVPGVVDYVLTDPVANVPSTVDASTLEVLVPGIIEAHAA